MIHLHCTCECVCMRQMASRSELRQKALEESKRVGGQQACVQEDCRGLQSVIYTYSCCVRIKKTICISESSLYLNSYIKVKYDVMNTRTVRCLMMNCPPTLLILLASRWVSSVHRVISAGPFPGYFT